jgi:catechol 2,3-dioxygenase-like lactoylglutathione lyase family enzyme
MEQTMNVLRIGFLGTRTTEFQPMASFMKDVLGLETVWAKPDWAGFRLPTGKNDFVEIYGPANQDSDLYPDSASGVLIAFIVDDVVGAHAEVAAADIEILGDIVWAADSFGWFFLRAPDGNIYCIEQVPE